jgi:hypothetical protein
MFAEGVHRSLLCSQIPGKYSDDSLCDIEPLEWDIKGEALG